MVATRSSSKTSHPQELPDNGDELTDGNTTELPSEDCSKKEAVDEET